MSCVPERKSYFDSIEVELHECRISNPTYPEQKIRDYVAHSIWTKYKVWRARDKIEKSGKSEYENGEFALNESGDMWYPKTGETAEGLHLRQKALSELPGHDPSEYSQDEHDITRLVVAQLRAGSDRIVTSYGNRDLIEFVFDRSRNKGVIRVINTAAAGRKPESNTMRRIAKEKFKNLHETTVHRNIFVLSDKPSMTQIQPQVYHAEHFPFQIPEEPRRKRVGLYNEKRSHFRIHDKGPIVPPVEFDNPEIIERIVGRQRNHQKQIQRIDRIVQASPNTEVVRILFFVQRTGAGIAGIFPVLKDTAEPRKEKTMRRGKEYIRLKLNTLRKHISSMFRERIFSKRKEQGRSTQSKKLLVTLEKNHIQQKERVLQKLLNIITKQKQRITDSSKTKRVTQKLKERIERIIRTNVKTKNGKREYHPFPKRDKIIHRLVIVSRERINKIFRHLGSVKLPLLARIFGNRRAGLSNREGKQNSVKRTAAPVKEKLILVSSENIIQKLLYIVTARLNQRQKPAGRRKYSIQKNIEKPTRQTDEARTLQLFTVALIMWMGIKQRFAGSTEPPKQKNIVQEFIRYVPMLWLIQAIVRYLAMIRESGGTGFLHAGQKKTSVGVKQDLFPSAGIIFTFSS